MMVTKCFKQSSLLTSKYLVCTWTFWGGPFLRACFFIRFEDQKRVSSFVILFCFNFHRLEALEACLEACSEVFCSNVHGLATLEFETCIEACLQLCSSENFLFCCNFHQLEASRLALRPSLCASCDLKF